ncbi:REP-associated tyrosine transposase [Planctomicrobium sp. SH661]|uniref:REP-associated tyrosine transposase n=1 Tax=Planctomicrobium sp. SH661 TaxID=3448124 RepID=UPI003F5BBC9F
MSPSPVTIRRRLLDHDRAKKIVLGTLNSQLSQQQSRCVGFVIMPDHVHAIVWFPKTHHLSLFMKQWKTRSSTALMEFYRGHLPAYANAIQETPIWQRKYYVFHIHSQTKLQEKLSYMHENPVRANLVTNSHEWMWSSARWYAFHRSVGVPIQWVD